MSVIRVLGAARARLRALRWRRRPPAATIDIPTLRGAGPSWFVDLVDDANAGRRCNATSLEVAWRGTAPTDERTIVVDAPFVSPRRSHPGSLRSLPRGTPPTFEPLAESARQRGVVGPAADVEHARAAQLEFRSAHTRTLLDVVGSSLTGEHPTRPMVDVVCVSCRPDRLASVAEQFEAQRYEFRRLTIVLTAPDRNDDIVRTLGDRFPGLTIEERRGTPLGTCLNEAIESSDAPLVAKWDDDDWYGSNYLHDLVLARNATGAVVTGKHSYFTYVASQDRTFVRFPGVGCRDVSFLAGGTLLIDRRALGGIRFPDVDLGEDTAFLRACQRARKRVFAADSFNYIQVRDGHNTWTVDDDVFLTRSVAIGEGLRLDRAMI